jgi:hypothetical protein
MMGASRGIQGLALGVMAGILDAGLILAAEPDTSFWVLLQSLIAWTIAGWVALVTASSLPPLLHCVLVIVALNIPWYIQFAAIPGTWSHLPPLVMMSVLFGAVFGWAKKLLS